MYISSRGQISRDSCENWRSRDVTPDVSDNTQLRRRGGQHVVSLSCARPFDVRASPSAGPIVIRSLIITTNTTLFHGRVLSIHRVKWRHISVVAMRSPFCRSTRHTMRVVKWWRFVALFESNWISWFKDMSVLSLSYWESDVYWRQNNKYFAELAPQNGGNSWYEEITSLSPYVYLQIFNKFFYDCHKGDHRNAKIIDYYWPPLPYYVNIRLMIFFLSLFLHSNYFYRTTPC